MEMINRSIEALIYCVLGSQVKLRQSIVGPRASSYEVQKIYKKLVKDGIVNTSETCKVGKHASSCSRYEREFERCRQRKSMATA